jgi:hypothetical protein
VSSNLIFDIIANDKATKTIKGIGSAFDDQSGKVNGWKVAGVAALAGTGMAVVKFAGDSIDAYTEAQTAQSKLTDAYARFPALADVNIDKLRGYNVELGKKTRFEDDTVATGQAVLAQFGLTGAQLEQITPLLLDYAAKTGQDLPSAAGALGKALLGNGKAMKAIGLDIKDTGSAAGNFDQLMGGLRTQVGGFAEKEGTTAAGKTAILKNQFGELEETVGSKLVPILTKVTDIGLKVVDSISQNISWLGPLVVGIGAAAAIWWVLNAAMTANPIGLVIVAIGALVGGLVWAYNNIDWVRTAMNVVWEVIKTVWSFSPLGMIINNWTAITGFFSGAISGISGFFTGAWGVIQTVFGWTPLGMIINNWTAISGFFSGAISGISGFFMGAWGVIQRVFGWTPLGLIINNWDAITGFLSGLPSRIGSVVSGMWDGIASSFKGALNKVIGWWNDFHLELKIPSNSVTDFLHLSGAGFTVDTPNIPFLAAGGTAIGAGWSIVGERGPELKYLERGASVVPLNRAGSLGNSLGGPVDLSDATINALAAAILAGAQEVSTRTTAGALASQASKILARPRR